MELMTQRHRLPEILEAREALETQLAALAAGRRTDGDVAEMERALAAMAADIADGGLGEEGDRLFHEAVTRAARSPMLADFMAALAVPISETRRSSLGEPGLLASLAPRTSRDPGGDPSRRCARSETGDAAARQHGGGRWPAQVVSCAAWRGHRPVTRAVADEPR